MMTQGRTVWCQHVNADGLVCSVWDQVSGNKRRATKEFKISGWTKKGGKRFCPSHTPKQS